MKGRCSTFSPWLTPVQKEKEKGEGYQVNNLQNFLFLQQLEKTE
jgi:hypothetical protein